MKFFCVAMLLAAGSRAAEIDWKDARSVARAAAAVSPSLRAARSEIAAARERVFSSGSLPEPMLMSGVQNQNADLSIDNQMTMYMAGLSQTIARPARRRALRSAASLDVQRLEREYEAHRAEVERDAVLAYYDAGAAQSQLATIEELEKLAASMATAARIRYEAGSAPQADMIRARLQQSEIRHQKLALRARRAEATARLAATLNLPDDRAIPPFALSMGHAEADEVTVTSPASNAAIEALEAEVRAAREEITLARMATRPDWTVEAIYGVRPYQKDTISVLARIELPLRKGTLIEPRIREALAMQEAAESRVEVLRQKFREEWAVAAARHNEAREQLELHTGQLVPESKLAYQSALNSYQSGQAGLEPVLAALQSYVALSIDAVDFVRQEREAEAEILALRSGARLALGPGERAGGMR